MTIVHVGHWPTVWAKVGSPRAVGIVAGSHNPGRALRHKALASPEAIRLRSDESLASGSLLDHDSKTAIPCYLGTVGDGCCFRNNSASVGDSPGRRYAESQPNFEGNTRTN